MTMPTQVSALGFVQLMGKMNLKDSLLPLFLPSIASPAVFYFMHQYMQASLPLEVIEAARIDGSSEFGTFNRIVLPMIKPALAVQAIFTFVGTWNDYMGPMIYLTRDENKTIQVGLRRFIQEYTSDYHLIMAASLVSLLPVSVVFLCLQKYFIEGIATSGLKG
jgi:multiple sugar transport system permease protein